MDHSFHLTRVRTLILAAAVLPIRRIFARSSVLALLVTVGVMQAHGGALAAAGASGAVQHDLCVFVENRIWVYSIDQGHRLLRTIVLPKRVTLIRGVGVDVRRAALYVAYGSVSKSGSLMRYNLLTDRVVYNRTYPTGIDSFAITPDGRTIYMPDGDGQADGVWRVIDAASGEVKASIETGGQNPHNTIVGLNGKYVYMGPRLSDYLVVAETATNRVIRRVGPLKNGVRPFTINGRGSLAFMETSGFVGFEVGDLKSGKILYAVPVPGYTYHGYMDFAPSHGISLSPDEEELYIVDWPHSTIHVFDVRRLPEHAPVKVADIRVHSMVGSETPCVGTNCMKEGWLLHSRDGRYVYVGDSGDVIDTVTRKSVGYLVPLANTRKMIEIDWVAGRPVFATSRYGVGYVVR